VVAGTLGCALRIAHPRRVDQHVEATKLGDPLRDGGIHRRLVAHVAGDHAIGGVQVETPDAAAAPAQRRSGGLSDAAGCTRDEHTFRHAGTGVAAGTGAGTARYSDGRKRFIAAKNLNVWSGHRVEFLPLRSMYQLWQPPFSHTVPCDLRWISSFHASCASCRGSIADTPARRMCASAWRM